mmetsp:Transcript_44782/g.113343  ORF Transcript_44782/g.113343 Transcript_44782/m.113343 type:complete len:252 (-) Transcript_44782:133-888(-)
MARGLLGGKRGEVLLLSEVQMRQSKPHATSEFDLLLLRAFPPAEHAHRHVRAGPEAITKTTPVTLVKSAGRTEGRAESAEPGAHEVLLHAEVLAVVECKHSGAQIKDHLPVMLEGLAFYSSEGFQPERVVVQSSNPINTVVQLDPTSFARFRDRSVARLVYFAGHDHLGPLALRKLVVDELLSRGLPVLRHDGSVSLDEKFRQRIARVIKYIVARAGETAPYMEAMAAHGNLWFLYAEGQHGGGEHEDGRN